MTDARHKPLKLAVVGHTNVGKTSLLRTLTRDVGFGEVSHRPSTTRHVEGARLSVDGQPLLELYDTPGLEDAIALLDYLERLERPGERLDGPARLARFLDGSEARQRFEQEAKVLRQLLASDAGLYVIDAREPVLAKYRDELEVLTGCGKPLLPVLNFVSSADQREGDWREALARLGLHALVRFDSVAPPEDGERRLYESLALLLEHARPALQRLIDDQEAQRRARQHSAARLIAELLVDCAACRRSVASNTELEQQAIGELRQTIRQREQRCVEALLKLYAFRPEDAAASDLPLLDGRWGDDLFNPETLKQLGVRVGGGIAAGAAAGAGGGPASGRPDPGRRGPGRGDCRWRPANRPQLRQPLAGQAQGPARADRGRQRAAPAGPAPTTTGAGAEPARACGAGQHPPGDAGRQKLARGQVAGSLEQGSGASAVVVAQPAETPEPGRAPGADRGAGRDVTGVLDRLRRQAGSYNAL